VQLVSNSPDGLRVWRSIDVVVKPEGKRSVVFAPAVRSITQNFPPQNHQKRMPKIKSPQDPQYVARQINERMLATFHVRTGGVGCLNGNPIPNTAINADTNKHTATA
jgi:hypothetical protein